MSIENQSLLPENKWLPDEEAIKYSPVIKKFLNEFFATPGDQRPNYGHDLDIGRPINKDMMALHSGDFEVGNIHVFNKSGNEKEYCFYVGDTEFHVSGEPAKIISGYFETSK